MNKKEILFGIVIAVLLALAVSPFASEWPDGLEKVAEDQDFLKNAANKPLLTAPAPDYIWPGVKNEKFATGVAGIAGTLTVFFLAYGMALILKK